jgi:hypothetical protein
METNKVEKVFIKREPMDERTYWFRIILVICSTVCIFTGSIVSCVAYESKLVADMTKEGASPIESRCSLGTQSTDLCQLYFADKK